MTNPRNNPGTNRRENDIQGEASRAAAGPFLPACSGAIRVKVGDKAGDKHSPLRLFSRP